MRSFIALPLPDDLADQLERFAARLKLGRPQPFENLHITLAFLGDQPQEALQDLHEVLDATPLPAIHAEFTGLEPLGGKQPSVLGLMVSGVDGVQKQVLSCARRAGITLPHRRFRAHVTLARLPRKPLPDDMTALGHALETHGAVRFPAVQLNTLSMYQSELHPDGARYEVLADYPLTS
ncbi:RNA 2',3'-cyclic phosphodiesterase [Aliiroseovarius pelagivivens]|uniref:RNA 2',3'-cyclic phosphodiesterase n=1 Tax=Aliiroseovarius pelagivivens TaxID=1639690 RepID=A0A2R8AII8_9RHOB|nr:RNA 2',3'-cyclic phosphodiesterase [Aliiroseovarius pelagivivens]SPF75861.1 RNA 2',3'-cyclic phosphodiesterase [Aliiroseovarius pelagivivens]